MEDSPSPLLAAFAHHPRSFEGFRHVYPVLSRRSGGLSLGVNLNLDRRCNFDCPYCQVDRRVPAARAAVDLDLLDREIETMLGRVAHTGLADLFPLVPPSRRILRDVALSGDGEPTLDPSFPEASRRLLGTQKRWREAGGSPWKLVLITNATLLDRTEVQRGLEALTTLDGEIWGKLDAGTEEGFARVSVSRVPLERIQSNLETAVRLYPLKIQTLWMEFEGTLPEPGEVDAWMSRILRIQRCAPLKGVQLHTIARATSREGCRPVPSDWLLSLGARLESEGIPVEIHGGIDSGSIASPHPG
ncbi:MAG: radical SAM protein [Fibrobacteria bacterium]|nr:radical SAM protein [Fibrobacteria bacterium]